MVKYAIPAVVAALALGAPTANQAQTAVGRPMPIEAPTNPITTNASATTGTIAGQPQPGEYYAYSQPGLDYDAPLAMIPVAMVAVPPGSVWIPAHYNWDPAGQNYVWLEGEFAQPPHPGAQWIAGRWQQTLTAWTWLDGHWN